jgi:hypothetical protein
MSEGNVFDLIKKLRKMHGHLSTKDRAVVVECIGALQDLSMQLWDATHTTPAPRPRDYTIRHLDEEDRDARANRDAALSVPQGSLGAEDPARRPGPDA